MRIRSIHIEQWRHFENVSLDIEDNTALVCIVGANGTGKSHLLELIAACAHRLGLSKGIDIPRGDPFADNHRFSLQFYLAPSFSEIVEERLSNIDGFAEWDRTIQIKSSRAANILTLNVEAGGFHDARMSVNFASHVVNNLNQSQKVHFLSLDADRAYPKRDIHVNEIAQAYGIDWSHAEFTRGRSYRTTKTLYDEWIKYLLAQENKTGEQLMKGMRRAKKQGVEPPEFSDPFEGFASSLQKVLPHLLFAGVDSKRRTLMFDTTGLELAFNQLSGGEREIAFLVGQIDRFGLRQGLFLLDEPELHLNSDLIRTWVAYLTGTVETGQIWLATHSLEAVEAAGQNATFVLERNEYTRKVDGIARLDTRPVLSALSRAVGTPAFSISQLLFAFIEGEESVGERERFRKLAGMPQNIRFMECGSCNEVVRRVTTTRELANEAEAGIRIAGLVDRDFLTDVEASSLQNEKGVYVLDVHEAENFFLHPPTLTTLLAQNGRVDIDPFRLVQQAADIRAGSWIFQHAMSTNNAKSLPEIPTPAKNRAKTLTWQEIEADRDVAIASVLALTRFEEGDQDKFKQLLDISANAYQRKRESNELWKICEGKQVLNNIAGLVGFAGSPALEQAAFAAWAREDHPNPEELDALRNYLNAL